MSLSLLSHLNVKPCSPGQRYVRWRHFVKGREGVLPPIKRAASEVTPVFEPVMASLPPLRWRRTR